MKRRIQPILSITAALILLSGLAYAVDKKKQLKPVGRSADTTSEERALKAELLDATEGQQKNLPVFGNNKKNADAKSNGMAYQLESTMQVDMR